MLVAGAAISLIAPLAAQASDINLDGMNSYSRKSKKSSKRFDSKSFINNINDDLASFNEQEAQQIDFEAGSFSETTSLSGKAVFSVGAIDHPQADSAATDGIDLESLKAKYQYTMDLNTSFSGDDNLYVRLRSGNGDPAVFGSKTYGSYLSSDSSKYSDVLNVDKIWYTFPVGERNTVWIGPKIENYYMHATTPSIYKPVTKQFTLGGNGAAYGASTSPGAGWAWKGDNGFAISSNFTSKTGDTTHGMLTDETDTSWATQIGYTKPTYSASFIVNRKTNGWTDSYYTTPLGKLRPNSGDSYNYGLRGWWRPEDTGSIVPSISLGYDYSTLAQTPYDLSLIHI